MKLDKLNQKILLFFLENNSEKYTICDLAKAIFEIKDRSELISKSAILNYRIKKLIKNNIINVSVIEGIKYYNLFYKKVVTGDTSIHVDNEKFSLGNCLIIKLKDNSILLFSQGKYLVKNIF